MINVLTTIHCMHIFIYQDRFYFMVVCHFVLYDHFLSLELTDIFSASSRLSHLNRVFDTSKRKFMERNIWQVRLHIGMTLKIRLPIRYLKFLLLMELIELILTRSNLLIIVISLSIVFK